MAVLFGTEGRDAEEDPYTREAREAGAVERGTRCFYCYRPVEYPCQYWQGAVSEPVYFHPACAIEFAARLLEDAQRAREGLHAWRRQKRWQKRQQRASQLERAQEIERVIAAIAGSEEEVVYEHQLARFLAETDPDGAWEIDDEDQREGRWLAQEMVRGGYLEPAGLGYRLTEKRSEQSNLRAEVARLHKEAEELRKHRLLQSGITEQLQKELSAARAAATAPAASAAAPVAVRLDPQRTFSKMQREEIYRRSNGHCVACGVRLANSWHADHIRPHSLGGKTEVINGQALCGPCNGRKSAKVLMVDEG